LRILRAVWLLARPATGGAKQNIFLFFHFWRATLFLPRLPEEKIFCDGAVYNHFK
jgi:hypothetical protein